jgi:hypothetical protein
MVGLAFVSRDENSCSLYLMLSLPIRLLEEAIRSSSSASGLFPELSPELTHCVSLAITFGYEGNIGGRTACGQRPQLSQFTRVKAIRGVGGTVQEKLHEYGKRIACNFHKCR